MPLVEHDISVLLPPDPLCHGCIPLAHHSMPLTWAALPPGKSIFGLSWGSRAWPRFRAKRPHFLLLTASLLYRKLSHFIFFSTRKGSVTGLSHCPGPLGCQAQGHLLKPWLFAPSTKHTEHSSSPFLPPTKL